MQIYLQKRMTVKNGNKAAYYKYGIGPTFGKGRDIYIASNSNTIRKQLLLYYVILETRW